jgi:hypothetical protein
LIADSYRNIKDYLSSKEYFFIPFHLFVHLQRAKQHTFQARIPLPVPVESFLSQQDDMILKGTLLQKNAQLKFLLSIPTYQVILL